MWGWLTRPSDYSRRRAPTLYMLVVRTPLSPSQAMSIDPNDRSYVQTVAESSLAPNPHRLELRGAPSALAWPRLCANCGAPASEQITVRKVFSRRSPTRFGRRGASGYVIDFRIVPAPVPFCLTCANQHRATVEPRAFNFITDFIFSWAILPVAGSSFFAYLTFQATRNLSLADPAGRVGWGIFAVLVAGVVWCVVLWWRVSAPDRIEHQTEITRACDFSRDVSEMFERERHIYAIRNKSFADAFAAANADRAWTAQDQAHSRRYSWVYSLGFLAALAVVAWLLGVFRR